MTKRDLIMRLRKRGYLVKQCVFSPSTWRFRPSGFAVIFRQHPKMKNFGPLCRKMNQMGLLTGWVTCFRSGDYSVELLDGAEYQECDFQWREHIAKLTPAPVNNQTKPQPLWRRILYALRVFTG